VCVVAPLMSANNVGRLLMLLLLVIKRSQQQQQQNLTLTRQS